MRVTTIVLRLELTQESDDPALWNWHELLDLAPDESATVEEAYDEAPIAVTPTDVGA